MIPDISLVNLKAKCPQRHSNGGDISSGTPSARPSEINIITLISDDNTGKASIWKNSPRGEVNDLLGHFSVPEEFEEDWKTKTTHTVGSCTVNGIEMLWMFLLGVRTKLGPVRSTSGPSSGTQDAESSAAEGSGVAHDQVTPTVRQEAKSHVWVRSAHYLSWNPNASNPSITMIVFQPREKFVDTLAREWHDSPPPVELTARDNPCVAGSSVAKSECQRRCDGFMEDPYLMLEFALGFWFRQIEREASWLTLQVTRIEMAAFEEAKRVHDMYAWHSPQRVGNDLIIGPHTVLKNVVFLLEGIDASISVVDALIRHHERSGGSRAYRALVRRRELFNGAKLTVTSGRSRLENVVNLVFNVQGRQEAKAALRDSRSMRVLSIVATIFVPISTISSIFGTAFFTSIFPEGQPDDGSSRSIGLDTNPQLTLLWAVAAPITVFTFGAWIAWDNWQWLCTKVALLPNKQRSDADPQTRRNNTP